MLTILVEGWTKYPHSYAIVNVYQLVALSKLEGVKLLLKEVEPYVESWPAYQSLAGILLSDEEEKLLKGLETYKEGTKVDIIYRISFAHNITPAADRTPVVVFYTAESQKLGPINFVNGTEDSFDKFVGLVKKGRLAAITPSIWSMKAFGKHERKVGNFLKVIPHGVDTSKFHPDVKGRNAVRASLNIPATDVVFLNVGAMTGNKNIIGILQAFYDVCQVKDNARLLLKGINALYGCERSVYAYLQQLVRTNKIDPVIFEKKVGSRISYLDGVMGFCSMRELYNAADCYVSPYSAEGFNMPALEAQACGCPCILPTGGPTADFIHPECAIFLPTSDSVGQGGNHMLVTDPQDIAQAMLKVINDGTDLINKASSLGPLHVEEKYTWDKVAKKMVKYFETLV